MKKAIYLAAIVLTVAQTSLAVNDSKGKPIQLSKDAQENTVVILADNQIITSSALEELSISADKNSKILIVKCKTPQHSELGISSSDGSFHAFDSYPSEMRLPQVKDPVLVDVKISHVSLFRNEDGQEREMLVQFPNVDSPNSGPAYYRTPGHYGVSAAFRDLSCR